MERELKMPEHIKAFLGTEVTVKLFKALDGTKTLHGILSDYDEESDSVTVVCGENPVKLARKDAASIRTVCEF